MKILTSQKEIRDFLKQEGEFGWGFNYTDYNFYITIKDVSEWRRLLFFVYRGEEVDENNLIVRDKIKIVSGANQKIQEGIIDYIKPFEDNSGHAKFVYEIKVSEIKEIEPEKRKGGK